MSAGFSDKDVQHMRTALALARRGLGNVWPNPTVGAVIVDRNGHVVSRGWTQPGGRPHAEAIAIERAGAKAAGATIYVTLEPCNHFGKTPPCTHAIIRSGIARVVATGTDPDPRVSGGGFAFLKEAGVTVETGLFEAEGAAINAGFFNRILHNRPWVTLKLAMSLDGRIALASGESQWITCSAARQLAHQLRAENDAILVGIGTVLADDPQLTCRLPGYEGRQPVRVVMDGADRIPADAKLLTDGMPTWTDRDLGHTGTGRPDPGGLLQALAGRGVTRLMIEGGGTVASAFLKADLVDEIVCVTAPMVIGGDGKPVVGELSAESLAALRRFAVGPPAAIGGDTVTRYTRKGPVA